MSHNGQKKPVITTKGWDVLIQQKDSSTNWIPLSVAKESNPIDVAEAAITLKIASKPAFNWWVKKALRHRKRIINKLKSNAVRKGRMKFGIDIPGTVEQASALDKANGNTLWTDAINKEMRN